MTLIEMALRPTSRPARSVSADGRFSACPTRLARIDRHPVRRARRTYHRLLTGATLIASILVAIAVWPLETWTPPGADGGAASRIVGRFTMDDFVNRVR